MSSAHTQRATRHGHCLRVPSPHAGEGQGGGCAPNPGCCRLTNDGQHAFKRSKHLFVSESENQISTRPEPCITHRVVMLPRIEVVCFSIELQDDMRGVADKVDDVSSHWRLSAEREPVEVMRLEIAP